MTCRLRSTYLLAGVWLACELAMASGLQVSPVSLTIEAQQNADGLWLSNTGDNIVHAQVRVYHWSQEGGEDKLTPSRGLVVSPPMLELAAGDRQLIRAIRINTPNRGAGAVEDAYRLIIDELPVDNHGKKGLDFVLRYSVPIFVAPTGVAPAAPQLTWALHREGDKVLLEVANTGSVHAQIASPNFVDAVGNHTELYPGLLGYVLPGVQMRWALTAPAAVFAEGGTLETLVNGEKAVQALSVADRPR